jgi:hypothetical protein
VSPISTNAAPRYKWRHLIENLFGKLKEFKRIAMRADKTTQASAPSSISPPHSSIRDESQQALGEKALCGDLRPYTARSASSRACLGPCAAMTPTSVKWPRKPFSNCAEFVVVSLKQHLKERRPSESLSSICHLSPP